MTRTISVFFQGMKQKYPHINIAITNFFIHLNTVWLFALLEELVLHPVKKEEMEKFIAEYIAFETAAVIILLYRISDVILDYVIETGVNVVALAPDGRAPFAGYCVEIVVLYVCALEARLAADDIPVGGVCSVAAALI